MCTCAARLSSAGEHFIGVTADAGPLIVFFFVDGVLCDGGGVQRAGWAWIPRALGSPRGSGTVRVGSARVAGGAIFGRALRNSELVSQWRSKV